MEINPNINFLDFNEEQCEWHTSVDKVPENEFWCNICYGKVPIVEHFCNMLDIMIKEFDIKFTAKQVISLAELTPGLTVYDPTPIQKGTFLFNNAIKSRDRLQTNSN